MSPAGEGPETGLVLGIEIDGEGSHPAAWRRADHPPRELFDPRRLVRLAETAERAGFAFATLEDDLLPPGSSPDVVGRIGSIERAAFLSSALTLLSLVPAVSTTYTEPFHVSSQLATIDHLMVGRSGWLVTATPDPAAARAWGRAPVVGPESLHREAALHEEAADAVRVVRALWDSWEDDAVIRDVTTSRYLDRDRLHYIDFTGATYSVKGPAIVPRPPQGQLVVLAPKGLVPDDLADVVLLGAGDVGSLRTAAAASRAARTCAEVEVALDTADETGAERVAALAPHGHWPDRGRWRYVGAAPGLVDLLRELAAVVDAVRLHPMVLDEDLFVLSQRVVPPLVGDPTVRRPRPGSTLRSTLGLPRAGNRFELPAADARAEPISGGTGG